MPIHEPHDKESWPRSDVVPNDVKDSEGAKQRDFLGIKLSGAVAVFIVICLISIFGALIAYFLLG